MRYLVKARVKPDLETALPRAIADGSLGRGSIAGDEYDWDMQQARIGNNGVAHWAETCFFATPLAEEPPFWEEYFELLSVKDAHNRKNCRHENGTEPWACFELRLHKTAGGTPATTRPIISTDAARSQISGVRKSHGGLLVRRAVRPFKAR